MRTVTVSLMATVPARGRACAYYDDTGSEQRRHSLASITRQLFDTDEANAAKAVTCPHIRELRHLPERTPRYRGPMESIAPAAPRSDQDRQFSRALQLGLQGAAGQ